MAKILYVDQDKRISGVVRDLLTASGHECATLSRGAQACDSLRELGADLMIVEVLLPDVCGFEILRRIRADRELFATPVMLVSQMNTEEEVQHGMAQGADDYLQKPPDAAQFLARVKSLLAAAALVRQPDPLTHLMNEHLAKYTVEHHLSLREPFALVCLELMQLAEFGQKAGAEAGNKVLRHAAHILEACARPLKDDSFQAAHMGAAHFMCLMRPDMAGTYCEWVCGTWRAHVPALYASIGLAGTDDEVPRVGALVYYTVYSGQRGSSVHDCFQKLMTIREHAHRNGEGIYADRRAG
jgi:DNA-binding response OmpR family regulator